MGTKDVARRIIEELPEGASMDEIIHALYVTAKFDHGESEIRSGAGVPHAEAKRRLEKWAR